MIILCVTLLPQSVDVVPSNRWIFCHPPLSHIKTLACWNPQGASMTREMSHCQSDPSAELRQGDQCGFLSCAGWRCWTLILGPWFPSAGLHPQPSLLLTQLSVPSPHLKLVELCQQHTERMLSVSSPEGGSQWLPHCPCTERPRWGWGLDRRRERGEAKQ